VLSLTSLIALCFGKRFRRDTLAEPSNLVTCTIDGQNLAMFV
jgi:hypothetical protein